MPIDAEAGSERRSYFRVLTRLPVRCRPVEPGELESLADAIRQRRAPDPTRIDPALAVWLDRIERKLDRLLIQFGIAEPVTFGAADVQEVMLSGSGMSFVADAPCGPGTRLLVEFEIPGPPSQRVRCLAHVVQRVPGKQLGEPASLAVEFDVIHDGDREGIIHHAVEVQRCLLKRRVAHDEHAV